MSRHFDRVARSIRNAHSVTDGAGAWADAARHGKDWPIDRHDWSEIDDLLGALQYEQEITLTVPHLVSHGTVSHHIWMRALRMGTRLTVEKRPPDKFLVRRTR